MKTSFADALSLSGAASPATQPGDVPEAPSVRVKPLKWQHFDVLGNEPEQWFANDTSFGGASFTATFDKDCELPWVARPFPPGPSNYATADEAKAALETARESRILSALDLTSQDAMAKALEDAREAIASLDEDALGRGRIEGAEEIPVSWPYRDELLSKIDATLAASRHPKEPNP